MAMSSIYENAIAFGILKAEMVRDVYITERIGESGEPWGIPILGREKGSEVLLLIIRATERWERKDFIHRQILDEKPKW